MSHLRVLCIGLLLGLAAGFSHAAEAPRPQAGEAERLSALEARLDANAQTIEQLCARVRELELQLAQARPGAAPPASAAAQAQVAAVPAAAPPAATAEQSARLDRVESDLAQITAASSASSSADRGLAIHGFADVGVGNHNVYTPDRHGATVGSIDFYLAPQLGERVKGLVEMNVEVEHDTGSVGIDLERTQLGYQFSEAATLWLGRFHTPYGYYNTAFHHGLQILTALRRPQFLAFEDQGGIMPPHTTGLWLTGLAREGEARVQYDLFVGNGQHVVAGSLNAEPAGSFSRQVVFGGRLGLRPGGAWSDLQIGLSAFSGRIDADDVALGETRVNIGGLYAFYDSDRWENQFEMYFFRNQSLHNGTGTHHSTAGFAQLGYRAGLFTPYLRYEHTALDQSDVYFASQTYGTSYHREALGLRFDLNLKTALKAELAQTHNTDRMPYSFSDLLFQAAVRF